MVLFSTLQRIKNRASSRGSAGSTSELTTSLEFLHYEQQAIRYSTAELFLMGNLQNYLATHYPPFSHYLFLTETLQTDLFKGVQGEMNSHHMPGFPLLFSTRGYRNWSTSVYTVSHSFQQCKTAATWKSNGDTPWFTSEDLGHHFSDTHWFRDSLPLKATAMPLRAWLCPGTFYYSHWNFPLFAAYHHHKKEHPVT